MPGEQTSILFVPGWNGSGPGHWQRLWHSRFENTHWLHQDDWCRPALGDWLSALDNAVQRISGPLVLVAHSLGSALVAHWSARRNNFGQIQAALLVAPPWLGDAASSPAPLKDFAPAPTVRMRFPSWLVVSENDPYLPVPLARCLAEAWGSTYVGAGACGHLNVASGHGEWPKGERLLRTAVEAKTEKS